MLGFKTQQEQTVLIWLVVRKALARVRKKKIQAEVKYRKIRISCQQKSASYYANLEVIYSKIGEYVEEREAYNGLTVHPDPPSPKIETVCVKGDAHVRTDAQIKFLYYAQSVLLGTIGKQLLLRLIDFVC